MPAGRVARLPAAVGSASAVHARNPSDRRSYLPGDRIRAPPVSGRIGDETRCGAGPEVTVQGGGNPITDENEPFRPTGGVFQGR